MTEKAGGKWFRTTRWSLIQAAKDPAAPEFRRALAELCEIYWPPVYAFIRSRGHDADAALDLAQGFFTQLLDKNYLKDVQRVRAKFRTFLLVCVKHFLANEWDRSRALKRGGGQAPLRLDPATAESLYRLDPADPRTPEREFERQWGRTLIRRALDRVREDAERRGGSERFRRFEPYLLDEADGTYEDLAAEVGTTANAAKVAVHRLRRKLREFLRAEVAQTVHDETQVEAELRFLLAAVGD